MKKKIMVFGVLIIVLLSIYGMYVSHQPHENEFFKGFKVDDRYAEMKIILKTDKSSYKIGEPIFFQIFICNESNQSLYYCNTTLLFKCCRPSLKNSDHQEVAMTLKGKKLQKSMDNISGVHFLGHEFRDLPPGQKELLDVSGMSCLTAIYDITLSGTYEFQMECVALLGGQLFVPPLESNKIMVHIEDEFYVSNDFGN